MTTANDRAKTLLAQKVRETIGKCGGVGGAAVLVRNGGQDIISSAQGSRKFGARGAANRVAASDRWGLGSISKPVTGTVIGLLIQKRLGSLRWTTTLGDVFPELFGLPFGAAREEYRDVSLEMLIAHVSGLHYDPLEPNYGDPWYPQPRALGYTDSSVIERRRKFTHRALTHEPLFEPGTGSQYGSGPIVCAAMVEKRTGKRFERLLKELLYEPLGMNNSGWGTTSTADLEGVWQHGWDSSARQPVPAPESIEFETNFNIRGVSGFYCMSISDMGRFLREHLRSDPKVLTVSTRAGLHNKLPSEHSNITRGSWGFNGDRNLPASAGLSFDGNDGRMYASTQLHRLAGWGAPRSPM